MTDYKMTPRLQKIIRSASTLLTDVNQDTIGVEHVMMAILDDPASIPTQVVAQFVEPVEVRQALQRVVESDGYRGT